MFRWSLISLSILALVLVTVNRRDSAPIPPEREAQAAPALHRSSTNPPLTRPIAETAAARQTAASTPILATQPAELRDLSFIDLSERCVPLTSASPLFTGSPEHASFTDPDGVRRQYQQGLVLLKLKGSLHPAALKVPPAGEFAAVAALSQRADVQFAELNIIQARQYQPADPDFSKQWHHEKLRTTNLWALSLGRAPVTLAIVDTPFQMDHPDLAAHVVPGFDLARTQQVNGASGFFHSTIAAGLAGAVIDNTIGVPGMVQCRLMPVDIGDTPDTGMMYRAVIWAADHGVRIVNLSWDGAYSDTINAGAEYLEQTTRGVVLMAGVNNRRFNGPSEYRSYKNQPKIWAVAMTDTNDVQRSVYGPHIDFAAPGYDLYSTTINSGYTVDSGTSYSTPLLAGVVAWVMSVNPSLDPRAIFELLKNSTIDLGSPGYDQYYGWGRVDLAALARLTIESLRISHRVQLADGRFTVHIPFIDNAEYLFVRSPSLTHPHWEQVSDFTMTPVESGLQFEDKSPPVGSQFYRVNLRLH